MKYYHLKQQDQPVAEQVAGWLGELLEQGLADLLLLPQQLPSGVCVAPTLVQHKRGIVRPALWAPFAICNTATIVAALTREQPCQKIAAVLRPCEIRALIELGKFKQAALEQVLIIGLDCPGTFEWTVYQRFASQGGDLEAFLQTALQGSHLFEEQYELRECCQTCTQPWPDGAHISVHLVDQGNAVLIQDAAELLAPLSAQGDLLSETTAAALDSDARQTLLQARQARAQEIQLLFQEMTTNAQQLAATFAACRQCYNCREVCPLCYCRECVFATAALDYNTTQCLQKLAHKDVVRMPPDTLLFHLTRLNHMVTSCVACGQCSSACPQDLPVARLFKMTGEQVQRLFEYHPGQDPAQPPPLACYQEVESWPDPGEINASG